MSGVCPCCGYDLVTDEPIERAGISMQPYGPVRFNGAEVRLTRGESAVLWSLMKAGGRPLAKHIISERTGHEGDSNSVEVLLTRIRRKLEPHGEVPIVNCWGVGVFIQENRL